MNLFSTTTSSVEVQDLAEMLAHILRQHAPIVGD